MVEPRIGGVAVWTQAFLAAAPRFGLTVSLIRIGPRTPAEILGLRPRIIRAFRDTLGPLAQLVSLPKQPETLVHVCTSGGPGFVRGLSLAMMARALGAPTVLHLHSKATTLWGWSRSLAQRMVGRPGWAMVSPCAEDTQADPALVKIPNLVSPDFGADVHWSGPSSGNELRLGFVGWLIPEKGIFEMAQALARLPLVRLTLFGPTIRPEVDREFHEICRDLGIEDRVRVAGLLDASRLAFELSQVDALVSPSRGESFGYAVAEAMKLGVPVISTRTGLLVEAPADAFFPIREVSVDELVHVLETLIEKKHELLPLISASGRQYFEQRLSEGPIMEQWVRLYERLLASPP